MAIQGWADGQSYCENEIKRIPYIITMLRMCDDFLRECTFFVVAQTLQYFRI